MTTVWPSLSIAPDRPTAEAWAAGELAEGLTEAIRSHGHASLFCSGGSSPKGTYASLSKMDLDWPRIVVSLADERWVEPEDSASNARLVRDTLLQNKAQDARFVPMKTDAQTPFDAVAERAVALSPLVGPQGVAIVGMGPDLHTLSWFPHGEGLAAALDVESPSVIAAIKARQSEVTGQHLLRMTLSASAIARLSRVILLMFGEDKRAGFEAARNKTPADAPIRHLVEIAGHRLTAIWAA